MVFIVTEQNAFFTELEKLLVATLFEKRRYIRKIGLISVLTARQTASKFKGVKISSISTLNFDAANYIQLIDWNVQNYHLHVCFGV